ncbi:hypothetical protein ABZ747_17730 [Kitasatospora cineracea]|uniref:hypothetical protein n=1 Tax=Kitasatospora cineracea TaxID=88074 RepID=UPI0033DAEA41
MAFVNLLLLVLKFLLPLVPGLAGQQADDLAQAVDGISAIVTTTAPAIAAVRGRRARAVEQQAAGNRCCCGPCPLHPEASAQ